MGGQLQDKTCRLSNFLLITSLFSGLREFDILNKINFVRVINLLSPEMNYIKQSSSLINDV